MTSDNSPTPKKFTLLYAFQHPDIASIGPAIVQCLSHIPKWWEMSQEDRESLRSAFDSATFNKSVMLVRPQKAGTAQELAQFAELLSEVAQKSHQKTLCMFTTPSVYCPLALGGTDQDVRERYQALVLPVDPAPELQAQAQPALGGLPMRSYTLGLWIPEGLPKSGLQAVKAALKEGAQPGVVLDEHERQAVNGIIDAMVIDGQAPESLIGVLSQPATLTEHVALSDLIATVGKALHGQHLPCGEHTLHIASAIGGADETMDDTALEHLLDLARPDPHDNSGYDDPSPAWEPGEAYLEPMLREAWRAMDSQQRMGFLQGPAVAAVYERYNRPNPFAQDSQDEGPQFSAPRF